jgi:uncharacterized lipoprotein YmbA
VKRVIRLITALALMGLSLAGCGSLLPKPQPNSSGIYLLASPLKAVDRQDQSRSIQISLGVGPVRLPGYLDRREILTRVTQSRLDVSQNDRWAEPLDENFTHVLAQNLSVLLGSDGVISYPWPIAKGPDYRVTVEVLQFECNSALEAQLSARWWVTDRNGTGALEPKESRLTRAATDRSTDASVAALSETVADLSRQIAQAVIALASQRERY